LRRSLVLTIAVLASLVAPTAAQAAEFDPNQILFPVQGDHYYSDTFDAPRVGHTHEATDIMTYGVKGVPVIAVADGEIDWISSTCCGLSIDHGGGWETWYIHLNNDTPGTDDGQGWGIADGIERGTHVVAGQLIGWVGDSGNAEGTAPHLHFEIKKDGVKINPYPYLLIAEHNWIGQFRDDDGNTHEANIEKIYAAGITKGCNPPTNNEYCPQRSITRGEMAAFISRTLGLTEASGAASNFDDVAGNTFEGDIDRVVTAGIGFGCDEDSYCPDRPLIREEMAEMLVRAFGYENPDGVDHFTDDEASPFEESIDKLANANVTLGCNPPANDKFCPERTLTRAEMASFFARALDL
jgi:Peptidase family M23/S-layer homology domain